MFALYLLLGLLILIGWILFTPIVIEIDTLKGVYAFRWKGLVKVRLVCESGDLKVQVASWFWKKSFDPFQFKSKKKKKTDSKKRTKTRDFRKWTSRVFRVLKSFRINACSLSLDTNDFVVNSYLWPVFYFLDSGRKTLRINYEGKFNALFIAKNKLFRILRALFL